MWVLTLALLAGSSLNNSVISSCPITIAQAVYQSHPESEIGKVKNIVRPIPPVIRTANVDQEGGGSRDKDPVRTIPPVKPLKMYSYIDQEGGGSKDKDPVHPIPPVKPLKMYS